MNSNTLYIGREWNVDHDRRVKVGNAELRYTVLGRGEPVQCIHGTSIPGHLATFALNDRDKDALDAALQDLLAA